MIMSFFGNLYHGHYCPVEKTPGTDEFRAASKRLAEASEKLFKALNDGQKALLEEYRAAFADCVDAVHVEAFRQGFMLGTEFIKETQNNNLPPVGE